MKRSDTKTIISALRVLSVEIQSDDGVANMAISEAADRLQELYDTNAQLNERLQGSGLGSFDKFCKEHEKREALAKCKSCSDTGKVYSNEPDGIYYDCPDCKNGKEDAPICIKTGQSTFTCICDKCAEWD